MSDKTETTQPETDEQSVPRPSFQHHDKRKSFSYQKTANKRPFNQNGTKQPPSKKHQSSTYNTEARHGGTSFDKIKIPSSAQSSARLFVHSLYCSNHGIDRFVPIVYNAMISKDWKLEKIISLHQLQYVTSVALLNRMHQVSLKYGTTVPQQTSLIKDVAKGIRLPDIIARYVESFGFYKSGNGVSVIPAIGRNYEDHYVLNQQLMLDPDTFLHRGERTIPNNPWHIDESWITSLNLATTRAQSSGMSFREVDNSVLLGTNAMLSSYEIEDNMVVAYCSEIALLPETQLAACYAYRNRSLISQWLPGSNHLITDDFITTAFSTSMFVTGLCVEAFGPRPFGTR
jgi:hypothetical protein